MRSDKRFSRFILYVLIIFQGVSLAFIVGILYGILSRTLTANFHNQIRAEATEVSMTLHDRLAQLNARLQELKLNNALRVGLMLGVENPILEVLTAQYPHANGAFYCVRVLETGRFLPQLPERLVR
jgi:hypothetical protein